jgi:pyruvate formate lyase activating enzyme
MPTAPSPLAELLARHTREGHLYEKLPQGRLRCVACGHRCLIPPDQVGICKVRFNEAGTLRVPWGYVGALHVDPVEKKPFFHALPGARALSFGMLGCDYHCGYCFTSETRVVTHRGPETFADLFAAAMTRESRSDADLAYPAGLEVITASGSRRPVRGIVRHRYHGPLVCLKARYLPALRCTPDHRVYAATGQDAAVSLVAAKDLGPGHYLAIPRGFAAGEPRTIDAVALLADHRVTHRVGGRRLARADRELILTLTSRGHTSHAIGQVLGKAPSQLRHVRSRFARGGGGDTRTSGVREEHGCIRFPMEHAPGIPAWLPLDTDLAALLGYYCAEGCVARSKRRPNSHVLSFTFSHQEVPLVDRVRGLLSRCLGVDSRVSVRERTVAVVAGKTSAALLFKALAGAGSRSKRVPSDLTVAPIDVVRSFVDAYVDGDGHRYPNGKISVTTVSSSLAYGIAWLVLRLGHLPSIHAKANGQTSTIQGRVVHCAPVQYTVVWYVERATRREVVETPEYFLVPLREVSSEPYEGDVYNMEVDEEHTYLAGLFAVANCQNWITSQALRDPRAVAPPEEITPAELVGLARRHDARIVTSTYNEPLITSEWAVDVFREARAAGLVCSYVSNGNGTPEVLDYIRPWIDLYTVDLKSFRDRHYRELGGTLERVLWTIRALHERGVWLEVVTLIIPGFNDSDEELADIARFLVSVSPDVPWHVTAFHKDYKMTGPDNTGVRALLRAAEIGARAGLRFVYAGNLPGQVGRWENTWCPGCGALLVERQGFRVRQDRLRAGTCPDCRRAIPGFWSGR